MEHAMLKVKKENKANYERVPLDLWCWRALYIFQKWDSNNLRVGSFIGIVLPFWLEIELQTHIIIQNLVNLDITMH